MMANADMNIHIRCGVCSPPASIEKTEIVRVAHNSEITFAIGTITGAHAPLYTVGALYRVPGECEIESRGSGAPTVFTRRAAYRRAARSRGGSAVRWSVYLIYAHVCGSIKDLRAIPADGGQGLHSNARKKHCKVKAYNSKCFPLNGVSLYLEFGGGGAGLDSGRTQVAPSGLLGLS